MHMGADIWMDAVDFSDMDADAGAPSQVTVMDHASQATAIDQLELPIWSCRTDIDNAIASLAPPDASFFEPKRTRASNPSSASGRTHASSLPTQAFYSTDPSAGGARDKQICHADECREVLPGHNGWKATSNEKDMFFQATPIFCPVQQTTERPLDVDEAIAALPPPAESLFEPRKRHCNPALKPPSENSNPSNDNKPDHVLKGRKDRTVVRRQWSAEEEDKFINALAKLGPEGSAEPTIDARTGRVTVHLGPGVAEMISMVLGTRSVTQVRSHAQKHFIRLHRQNTTFRRASDSQSPGAATCESSNVGRPYIAN